jgi:luciferase family oxidoreductase group 1
MSREPSRNGVIDRPRQCGVPLRLGILDLCLVSPGQTDRGALFDTFELAVHAEALGYTRYWLAEHHDPGIAHGCPELLASLIARLTGRLRVGPAGVLLRYYSPLKVAKTFRLLQALFPGRIDLGLGAGGVDEATARALLDGQPPQPAERYAEKVADLIASLQDREQHVTPAGVGTPEVWVLGSGGPGSPRLAARHGAAFGLSLFLAGSRDDPGPIHAYREHFRPGVLRRPRWNVAVAGVCAETEGEAHRLLAGHTNAFLVPTVVGSPGQCREQLQAIRAHHETDEIIFLDLCPDLKARARSYQLLAEILALEAAPACGQGAGS